MTRYCWLLGVVVGVGLIGCASKPQDVPLITGKNISSTQPGVQEVGSMPMNLISAGNGKFVITTDMGYRESLWVIRSSDGVGVSHLEFPNTLRGATPATTPALANGEINAVAPRSGSIKTNGLYYGLAAGADGMVYASQGGHDSIAVYALSAKGVLTDKRSIATKKFDFPAGLALDDRGYLYVANNSSGGPDPLKSPGSVAIYDVKTRAEVGRYAFTDSHLGTTNYPLAIAAISDGSKTYVVSERDDCVYVLDTRDVTRPKVAAKIETGAHPVALLLNRDQTRLYVANSLSDTISVIGTKANRVISTVLLRPQAARDIPGVTPTGLALGDDGKTLYATLGDMNAIAVVDTESAQLNGYFPAGGWYPSALAVVGDGTKLIVANAKGSNVRNPTNNEKGDPTRRHSYVLSVLEGNVSTVQIPDDDDDLKDSTEQVLKDNHLDRLTGKANPLDSIGLSSGKIKHVIYIIKENRTYDQILGDEPNGDGDKSLLLFGKDITPNEHALAERFVLLDNLYACGEVSGDGWNWSTEGMADAFVTRNVPYNYSHRGRKFDFEGANNGYPTAGYPATTNPSLAGAGAPIPDVGNTGTSIWDLAKRAGLSYRNFGFYEFTADDAAGVVGGPDNYPTAPGLLPADHDLAGVTDYDYRRFDMEYPDSDAPTEYFKKTGDGHCLFGMEKYGKYDSVSRYSEWNREFQEMLAKDKAGNAVPALMMVRLPTDHTVGADPGKHTPRSYVADNDYALGEIVQSVSHSPVWQSTVIVVVEDDAQSGADHVDAHRTTAYVISPWIKEKSVDHHFYNTDSLLKTMELILGLPAMTQYDAIAEPVMDWDTSLSNSASYEAIKPKKELIADVNPLIPDLSMNDPRREMAVKSAAMDFIHADAAPADVLDDIVWKTVKGPTSKSPKPRLFMLDKDDD